MAVAITRGSLSYFLSVLKLLLIRSAASANGPASMINAFTLVKKLLENHKLEVIEQPLDKYLETTIRASSIDNSIYSETGALTTDGTYLYSYSSYGLVKIGTGLGGTMPGTVYAEIKQYRAGDKRVQLACIEDKLFYRSDSIGDALMLILDTKLLLETGQIFPTHTTMTSPKDSFSSIDLSHIPLKAPGVTDGVGATATATATTGTSGTNATQAHPDRHHNRNHRANIEQKLSANPNASVIRSLQNQRRDLELRMSQLEDQMSESENQISLEALERQLDNLSTQVESLENRILELDPNNNFDEDVEEDSYDDEDDDSYEEKEEKKKKKKKTNKSYRKKERERERELEFLRNTSD